MRFEAEFLSQDLHELLGVANGATTEQIRAAYRLKARASHPDLNPRDPDAGRRMTLLNRAVRVLLDPALRVDYERARRAVTNASASAETPCWFDHAQWSDVEWRSPEARPVRPANAGQRAFRRRVRHAGANVASRAQEALRRVGNDERLVLAGLCIVLGSCLLVLSHPSNAFWTRDLPAQMGATQP